MVNWLCVAVFGIGQWDDSKSLFSSKYGTIENPARMER